MMQCSASLNCGHRCMGKHVKLSSAWMYTYQTTELCSDPCKCQTCDRRAGGQRSMLKPAKNAVTSSRPLPSQPRSLLLDSGFQIPANPPAPSSSPDQWHAYANGGAKADDLRMLQKRREEDAAFEEQRRNNTLRPANKTSTAATSAGASTSSNLVEIPPQKPCASVSENTSLLVDLDINNTNGAHPAHASSSASYASAAGSRKTSFGGSHWSLLD